jgi:hypothetical protein
MALLCKYYQDVLCIVVLGILKYGEFSMYCHLARIMASIIDAACLHAFTL